MACGCSWRASCAPSLPLLAVTTRKPSNSSASFKPSVMCGSSSMTRMVFLASIRAAECTQKANGGELVARRRRVSLQVSSRSAWVERIRDRCTEARNECHGALSGGLDLVQIPEAQQLLLLSGAVLEQGRRTRARRIDVAVTRVVRAEACLTVCQVVVRG